MEKIVKIDGQDVGFRATALTPRLYRHKMGRDIVQDMNKLRTAYDKAVRSLMLPKPGPDASDEDSAAYQEAVTAAQLSVTDLEIFENVAYVMARQYDAGIPDTAEAWLDGFSTFSIYEVLPAILELWNLNNMTTAATKKK